VQILFIDIDYNKRQQKAKIHLAKPNKDIITHIHEKIEDSATIKLGDINELEFSIPYMTDDEASGEIVRN